ncbi:hypothetical protein GJAV_G00206840 [Gymnothorax javanicus]|nr:hypothetical protein GJAV_G00206840 [Gymnothorax javanicus]
MRTCEHYTVTSLVSPYFGTSSLLRSTPAGEVEELKFLCRDLVPQRQLETVGSAQDLFLRLQEQELLGEDVLFLSELLLTIRRLDLLRVLGTSPNEVEESLCRQENSYRRISSYRKMLYELSVNVTEEMLKSFKFLLNLPRNRLDSCASFLDVLVEMEKRELLTEDDTNELHRVLLQCDKQLAAKVQEYAANMGAGGPTAPSLPNHEFQGPGNAQAHFLQPRGGQSLNPSVQESCLSYVPTLPPSLASVSQTSVSLSENQSLVLDSEPGHSNNQHSEDYYKVSSRPLGYCLIINNYDFKEARERRSNLGNRKGTDRDAELLQSVFSRLHFEVEERRDLTGEELQKVAFEFGRRNHAALDAFVCCVLSHGEKGSVYGTDGALVRIRNLTLPFTSTHCPSLALKPKLFFIQACQGPDLQRGARIQADGPGDEEEEKIEEEEEGYMPDAGRYVPDTVPDDSDFLLGMATVEDFKSFRSVSQGSIFIQELCRQLLRGCKEREDILTVMTRVNRMVSSGVYLRAKQMPEPRYTLRKKLVLPID